MEKGTSTSKENLIVRLVSAADLIKKKYDVDIWFAEILGKRWSYIAGSKEEGIPFSPPERIELGNRFGMVSDGWHKIPAEDKERLISSLKETVRAYGCS
jgi:hypothetical protein